MIDWDAAFANMAHIPDTPQIVAAWSARSETFRAAAPPREVAYGTSARQRLDLFTPPQDAPKGLFMFVHGGYWQKFDKSCWSYLAAGALARGYAVAIPSYTLAPEARISEMTREITAALDCAAALVPGPVVIAGHSAGGHLVARQGCAGGDVLAGRLRRIMSISGLHDLRPLVETGMNDTLRLDADEAQAESIITHAPRLDVALHFWVGAGERPEFLRQNRLAGEIWGQKGADLRETYDPGHHHFSVIDGLAEPDSPITAALLDGL